MSKISLTYLGGRGDREFFPRGGAWHGPNVGNSKLPHLERGKSLREDRLHLSLRASGRTENLIHRVTGKIALAASQLHRGSNVTLRWLFVRDDNFCAGKR